MATESKTTQALLRALLREMEKSLAEPKTVADGGVVIPPGYKTRVNVKEFERGQEEGDWWQDGGDEDPFIGLRPRPGPKPRAKRRPR
jgi:hypothetical protein